MDSYTHNNDLILLGIPEEVTSKAKEACDKLHQSVPMKSPSEGLFCPRIFDVVCWNDTTAGAVAYIKCPDFLPGLNPIKMASKTCLPNGKWFRHPSNNLPWTNITNCLDDSEIGGSMTNETLVESEEEGSFTGINPQAILEANEKCEKLHLKMGENLNPEGSFCPRVFDGWACWNDTKAGTTAFANCPSFVPGFDPERMAHKVCMDNGTWFIHPKSLRAWSNFTMCIDESDYYKHQVVNQVYIVGYSISFFALLISLCVFLFFRSLKCKRVTIHKNLFFSFLVNNFLWLIWLLTVPVNMDVLANNGSWCLSLNIVMYYFLVSSYMWMFCEGLYLHTLLVVAFVSEERILKWFLGLGWGLPMILMGIYSLARGMDKSHNQMCWLHDSPYNYIISIPVFISLVVNLCFLINIVRVLLTKLRAVNATDDNSSTRKAVRATFILIPLLGLHYILVPFSPPPGTAGEAVYLVASAIASSFQGFAVSLLFCFFNGEVLGIFKRKWNQRKIMRSNKSYNQATSVSYMRTSMADGVTLTTTYEPNTIADDV